MTGAGKSVIVADLLAQIGHRFGFRLIVEEGLSHAVRVNAQSGRRAPSGRSECDAGRSFRTINPQGLPGGGRYRFPGLAEPLSSDRSRPDRRTGETRPPYRVSVVVGRAG